MHINNNKAAHNLKKGTSFISAAGNNGKGNTENPG